jgi:Zn-dependent peptidase ImmA (M78 family)
VDNLLGGDITLPVPIDDIIKREGINLLPYDMNDGISGILLIERDNITIGYDKAESNVRQRFTKAHELGHFMLHRDGELFVDKDYKAMMFRPSSSTPSDKWQEWEANEFAANILMPTKILKEEMEKLEIDYVDDAWIKELAKKFEVSPMAMSIRLSKLGLS